MRVGELSILRPTMAPLSALAHKHPKVDKYDGYIGASMAPRIKPNSRNALTYRLTRSPLSFQRSTSRERSAEETRAKTPNVPPSHSNA